MVRSAERFRKLLLRIYGSQAELLVDRESELSILRRLARKKIGPRLLGTFINGRFEQFFYAQTLTAYDVRVPETSKQIAKRMRELHEGIDLLKGEREGGPHVWTRWDKSLQRAEEVALWLDEHVRRYRNDPTIGRNQEWKARGFVCGTEWSFFRRTVDRYRKWLFEQYGGLANIKRHLIFAHNDVGLCLMETPLSRSISDSRTDSIWQPPPASTKRHFALTPSGQRAQTAYCY